MFELDLEQMPFDGYEPGAQFLMLHSEGFSVASEPGGLVAVRTNNADGYLTIAEAERLRTALNWAIQNASVRLDACNESGFDKAADDKHPF